MLVRLVSDLHTEMNLIPNMGKIFIPEMDKDRETVLVLAGDIGVVDYNIPDLREFFKELTQRFYKVLYVFGNHEFYGSTLETCRNIFHESMEEIRSLEVLENSSVVIDDVLFIGGTLWTNFRNGNAISMQNAEFVLNDFRKISTNSSEYPMTIRANQLIPLFEETKDYIFNSLERKKDLFRKTVVVTHHGPSYQSVPAIYQTSKTTDAFVSNLDYQIAECGPDFWFHGHTHVSFNYHIERTNVIVNPKGYPTGLRDAYENSHFNPYLRLDV